MRSGILGFAVRRRAPAARARHGGIPGALAEPHVLVRMVSHHEA
jgi:hypothetical protein